MRRQKGRGAWTIGVIALVGLSAKGAGAGSASGASRHTRATLLPEVASIQPGRAFTMGVRLEADAGWHTYWRNPGDSGLPTRIRWDLPAGFTPGDIQWPRPERLASGPLMSYGYPETVLLLVQIQPRADLRAGGTVLIRADVSWLECREACLPGKAALEVRLRVRDAPPRPLEPWRAAFAHARASLPEESAVWRLGATLTRGSVLLEGRPGGGAAAAPRRAYFFPYRTGLLEHAEPQPLERRGAGFKLQLPLQANADPPSQLEGLLVVDRTALEISVPVRNP